MASADLSHREERNHEHRSISRRSLADPRRSGRASELYLPGWNETVVEPEPRRVVLTVRRGTRPWWARVDDAERKVSLALERHPGRAEFAYPCCGA